MADLQKTVEIIFGGKNEISNTIGAIERDIDKMSAPLANAAESILKLDAALAALAVGGFVYAYKKSVEFESSVVNLRKVVGDSPADMELAEKTAKKLSLTYGESAASILESTAEFVQAGFGVQDSILLTKNAMDLKIAGDIEATAASERLVSILKGFKAPAEEAARVVDILNEVSNKYATNVEELSIGMADLSPIAKIMGFSFEETAAVLTPVIEVFGSGSESARALRTGLLKLVDDTAPTQAALKTLGVAQKDANGELRSGKDILYDVAKAFQNLSEPQKLFVTQQLVGIDQSAKMVEVFNGLDKTLEVTGVALKAYGSAQQEVDARLSSSEVTINRVKTGFENLSIAIGDKFKDAVTGMLQGGIEVEAALTSLAESATFDPLMKKISEFADSVGKTFTDIAESMPEAFKKIDFNDFLRTLDELGMQLADAFDLSDTSPEAVADKIQIVIDSVTSLLDITRGMGEMFVPLLSAVKSGIDAFNDLDSATKETMGNILQLAATYKMFGPLGIAMTALGSDAESMSYVANIAFASFENGINAIKVAVLSLAMIFATASEDAAHFLDYIPFYDASEDIKRTSERVAILSELLEEANTRLVISSDKVLNAFAGNTKQAEQATSKTNEYVKAVDKLPEIVTTDIILDTDKAIDNTDKLNMAIEKIPEKREVGVRVEADGTSIETTKDTITKTFPDGTIYITNIGTRADDARLKETSDKIKEAVPDKKQIEIEAKVDLEKLKVQAGIIEKSIEWKAKLDIAQVEADAKKVQVMFDAINNTITSTGATLSSFAGSYASLVEAGQGGTAFMEQQIENESRRRDETLEMQKELTAAEIDLAKARARSITEGRESVIQIQAEGLQPHLEAFMWEILSAIQIRATQEGAYFLLGA